MKPRVYVETSIFSYLTASLSNDLRVAANQSITIEWWDTRQPDFELFVSELVTAEANFVILILRDGGWMPLELYPGLM